LNHSTSLTHSFSKPKTDHFSTRLNYSYSVAGFPIVVPAETAYCHSTYFVNSLCARRLWKSQTRFELWYQEFCSVSHGLRRCLDLIMISNMLSSALRNFFSFF